ncbi:MAG: NAD(+)/NADH kinase [Deltaproteobacteria bacterium]|nr:NAD(+)/NADH kinase [Deltaproteobacteria bacterium]
MTAKVHPRVVVVTRPTEYELLLQRHGTRDQARFFLKTRGQSIDWAETRREAQERALRAVSGAIPTEWRRTRVGRSDLDRFLFEPEDIVVIVGQDGLVANVAKYLDGQPVIGVNPNPQENPGVLVPHPPAAAAELLARTAAGRVEVVHRSMVEATLDDGLSLRALNEVFLGHRSHQSARYRIRWGKREERQSSSGLIVATGTGATGWVLSVSRERLAAPELPAPTEARLAYFVREAWPSPGTDTGLTEGLLEARDALEVISEMGDGGVIFGDGVEADAVEFPWGARATVRLAAQTLALVVGP